MSVWQRVIASRRGLLASMGAAGALALTATYTLGGFSAAIQNTSSSLSSATLQLEQTVGSSHCYSTGSGSGGTVSSTNTGTCTTELLSTDQVPGQSSSVTVTMQNVGNHNASTASLAATACSAAAASDDNSYVGSDTSGFCGKVEVTIYNSTTGNCVYPSGTGACAMSASYTLSALGSAGTLSTNVSALNASSSASYVITTQLISTADNTDQGLAATLPLTWTINQ